MNLILDIGNTLAKVAVVDGQAIAYHQHYAELNLCSIETVVESYPVGKAILSAVGRVNPEIIRYLEGKCRLLVLGETTKLPIANRYDTPSTLGYDRVAVAVAANHLYPARDVLVVDAGTTITYELVTSRGEYVGGAISPGIALRLRSLHDHTAKLPHLKATNTLPVVGKSTAECIYAGVLNGAIAEVDGYINLIKANFPNIYVLLTGGDSNFFANKLKNSIFVSQNLMVVGLNRILEFNV